MSRVRTTTIKKTLEKGSFSFLRAIREGEMPRVSWPRLKWDKEEGQFKSHLFWDEKNGEI